MKSIVRTIMVLSVFGLAMGGFALAQDPLNEAPQEAVTEISVPSVSTRRLSTPITPAPPSHIGVSRIVLGRGGSRKVLIIPAEDVKVEDLTAIWQDLYVMSRIFDRKFSKGSRLVREVFPDYGDFFRQDSRATEAIYLQGYGALFLMEANFPLTAPPKSKEEEAKKIEEPADPTWQRAKQEIFSPRIPTGRRTDPREKYDAEQIEEVKKELIKSLKHAANIRNLKPDEWVILTVTGTGRKSNEYVATYFNTTNAGSASRYSGGGYAGGDYRGGSYRRGDYRGGGYGGGGYGGDYGYSRDVYDGGGYSEETGSPSAMVLTIRAKKSDVDAFAKGKLDFEQFRKQVQIFTY